MENLYRKAIHFLPKPLEQDIPTLSKFGGRPCIEALKEWPVTAEGEYMDFIGQLNFNEIMTAFPELAQGILPENGILMFFLDMKKMFTSQAYFKLLYRQNSRGSEDFALPPTHLTRKVFTLSMERGENEEDDLVYHQMFGNPAAVQDDPRFDLFDKLGILPQFPLEQTKKNFETERETVRKKRIRIFNTERKKWLLLWQINSDRVVFSSFFGDNGVFYIFIEVEKLRKNDFSNLQLIFQT